LTSTTTTFGVDGSGANDAINLLDGGNGTAESVLFLFNHDVIIDSITLSQFNGADAGTLNIKALGNFPLGPGTTTIGQIAEGGSAHRISMPDRSRQATPTGLALTA